MPSRFNRFVRTVNEHVTNPLLMHWAGRGDFYAAALHHVGRRSGREYVTPVVAKPMAGDRFVIPLPYGEDTDWCRNVIAAGGARLVVSGASMHVVNPRVARLPAACRTAGRE